jgi:hypothetical protein
MHSSQSGENIDQNSFKDFQRGRDMTRILCFTEEEFLDVVDGVQGPWQAPRPSTSLMCTYAMLELCLATSSYNDENKHQNKLSTLVNLSIDNRLYSADN